MSERPPCRLADLGLVCAIGSGRAEVRGRLLAGDDGLRPRDDLIPGDVRLFGAVSDPLPGVPDALARYRCRNNQLALAALDQVRSGVDDALVRFGRARVGVVLATSTGGLAETEAAFRERASAGCLPGWFALAQLELGGLPELVARWIDAAGPCYALSTACSAGAKALVAARSLLELGVCDAVLAGGVDSLCRLTANGFGALQALSGGRSNPMSRNRDGINLGEAAALFLVTRENGGVQLQGAGESSDAYHMSAPEPEGRGAEACMRAALADAGSSPDEIAYLNLHGTGTPQNDAMEARAVGRVLGTRVPCSSTKPLVGHTLAASGAIEAAFCWLLLAGREDGALELPPHRWDGVEDPELARLDLVKPGVRVEARAPARLMTNSFGFGGSNCALVLGEGPA